MMAMIRLSTKRNVLREIREYARKKQATARNGPLLLMKVECNSKPVIDARAPLTVIATDVASQGQGDVSIPSLSPRRL